MLHLHLANRFETLADAVVEHLGGGRSADPDDLFTPDTIVVPSAAAQRALTLAMARRHGVCAQVRFAWLAPWLWQQARALLPGLPERGPFDGEALPWRVFAALGDATLVSLHARLAHYLAGADAVMRLQLADRVADLAGQYAAYRPDWLAAWRAGERALDRPHADEAWQAALLARLAGPPATGNRPAGLDDAARELLALPDAALAAGLPAARAAGLDRAVHLVALPAMPPLHLALLRALARAVEVHVHALNPCAEYWFEVVDARRLAWLAARGRAGHHEVGHPLLAAWGVQAQSQLGLLVEAAGDGITDDAVFTPSGRDTLLGALQDSVLAMSPLPPASITPSAVDRSLELHVCHGLTRELEVLHDRLLSLVAADPALALSDIAVLVPDLEAATPLIDAVFGTAPPERALAYTVTGRALASVNAPARALNDLLALIDTRLPASGLAALLAQPVVARRFGLDDDALARVQDWLREAGVHWGLDDAQVQSLGLPAGLHHTLADGLERLFLGHALPDPTTPADAGAVPEPFDGLLPAGNAEGGAAQALGVLWQVSRRLTALHEATAQPLPPARWVALLAETMADWIAPGDDDQDALRELRQALQTLGRRWADAALTEPLSLALVRQALTALLDDAVRGGVPSGAVTFSALSSLRGLPFRVLCLLGLDDGAFPASARPAEFDLIAHAPRRGDRQRRDDDRNLFLDLLLSAREVLHLSHSGRSPRDNSVRPPSVLVDELFDHLEPIVAGGARRALVVRHPLQPFSEVAFQPGSDMRLRSHRADLAEALRHAAATRTETLAMQAADWAAARDDEGGDDTDAPPPEPPQPRFLATPLPPPEPGLRVATLAQLVDFFTAPQRHLLRRRLHLQLPRAEDELRDDEPFVPDGLARHALAARLLPALLAGAGADRADALARAGNELPAGRFGDDVRAVEVGRLMRHAERVRMATLSDTLPALSYHQTVDIDGVDWTLTAELADVRPEGLLRHRWGRLRASDRLAAWLHHLVLCAATPPGVEPVTTFLARDEALRLAPCRDAADRLAALMHLFAQGLVAPLAFFPRTAWALVDSRHPLRDALAEWQGARFGRGLSAGPVGEGDDPWVRLAWRGRPPPLSPDGLPAFEALAHAVFDPLRAHGADGHQATHGDER